MTLERIEAETERGFAYPYYLHAPADTMSISRPPILVEPPNMPGPSDDFEAHLAEAERRAEGGFGRQIADELGLPLLHPVFPRPVSEPVDWTHYTHSLDRETLHLEEGSLERIDRQLLAMVADARERLADRGLEVRERVCMNGFSASGTFANRFAALHPEHLLSVSAGGLNGMAILPIEEYDFPFEWMADRPVNYPVGVADIGDLTGEPFDREAFCRVNQFLYMGGEDDSDTLLYPDAWTDPDIRSTAIVVYGEDIHDDRFPRCAASYEEAAANAVFRVYPDAGHDPNAAKADIVAFHRRSIAGEDFEAVRAAVDGGVPP
jgi:hypothetical protein